MITLTLQTLKAHENTINIHMYSPIEDDVKPVSLFKYDVKETNDSETISQIFKRALSMYNRR